MATEQHDDVLLFDSSSSSKEVTAVSSGSRSSASAASSSNIPANWAQRWTPEEDDRLIAAVKEHGEKNWKKVAELVQTRDPVKCIQRWEKGLKPGIVKGRWVEEEDRMLVYLVSQGYKNWGQVAVNMPGRTSKQCRERWNNYLNPTLVHSAFTPEEDDKLLELQGKLGNKWAHIARALPGRTENVVKVRYNVIKRGMSEQQAEDDDEEGGEGEGSAQKRPRRDIVMMPAQGPAAAMHSSSQQRRDSSSDDSS